MKIGERGQVTIPKQIRDRFALKPETEVEFSAIDGSIILKKAARKLRFRKWRGRCKDSFTKLGYASVNCFIENVRGR